MKYVGKNDIEMFIEFLKNQKIKINPISESDFANLKNLVNNRALPKAYLLFMEKAGGRVEFWDGSSYRMDEIPVLRTAANELLEENGTNLKLSENDFVFFMHQGYQFYFFNLLEGDDPPVYYYGEGEDMDTYIKKSNTLSSFLIEYYNEVENLLKK